MPTNQIKNAEQIENMLKINTLLSLYKPVEANELDTNLNQKIKKIHKNWFNHDLDMEGYKLGKPTLLINIEEEHKNNLFKSTLKEICEKLELNFVVNPSPSHEVRANDYIFITHDMKPSENDNMNSETKKLQTALTFMLNKSQEIKKATGLALILENFNYAHTSVQTLAQSVYQQVPKLNKNSYMAGTGVIAITPKEDEPISDATLSGTIKNTFNLVIKEKQEFVHPFQRRFNLSGKK